jgi:hypothetical protein
VQAIAQALLYSKQYMDGRPLSEILDRVMHDIRKRSLDVISNKPEGHFAAFRRHELAGALNRLRHLMIS